MLCNRQRKTGRVMREMLPVYHGVVALLAGRHLAKEPWDDRLLAWIPQWPDCERVTLPTC